MAITRLNNNSITSITALPSAVAVANTPTFHAYLNSETSISNATSTKIPLATERYDVGGCFNNTGSTTTLNGISVPSYSFAPNESGKYFVGVSCRFNDNVDWDACELDILKNSDLYVRHNWRHEYYNGARIEATVELNGTSDYIWFRVYQGSGSSKGLAGESGKYTFAYAYKIIE